MFKRMLAVLVLLSVWSGVASAQLKALSEDEIKAKISSTVGFTVNAVADAPIDGLLQLSTDKGLFYLSEDGTYFMQARIYNLDAGMRNETEHALVDLRKDGAKRFSDTAIEFKAKNEKHVITVFTDITCGYCRKLHEEIGQYNDLGITVRYLAYPRSGLNSKGYRDMVSVWCATDPHEALTAAKAGDKVLSARCDNVVAEQYSFGQQIGVNGTPNIILPDGTLIPGYQPAAVLAQALGRG